MFNVMAVGGALLSLLVPASSGGGWQVPPPSDKIVIDVVTVNGSGCPKGTAAVAVAPDNTAFTVTFSSYLAQVGGDARPTDFRKNCQMNVRVHAPGGFTYAVASDTSRGFVSIAKGASGEQTNNYFFQGDPATATTVHNFSGGMEQDFETTDSVDVAALVFAPCGAERLLNINTSLKVNKGKQAKDAVSFMEMDSNDAAINTIYHLSWKKC